MLSINNMDTQINVTEDYVRDFVYKYEQYVDTKWVNLDEIVRCVFDTVPQKMITNDFYNYVADFCVAKSSKHFDYNILASRICVDRLHKTTSSDILEVAEMLYNNNGVDNPLVSKTFLNNIKRFHKKLNDVIDMDRDYLFDYFGIKTLERSYLLKTYDSNKKKSIVERPQHMIMRVAVGIHGANIDAAIETYEYISNRYFTHATPTLFNAGTNRQQLSSCYLLSMDDSLDSIMHIMSESAKISKYAGGIGIALSSIRAKGSIIRGTNGLSDGLVPLCNVLNKLARYVNQGGKRPGSIACFVADTEVFTANEGVKKIQDVKIGDLVVTHENRLKPVEQVHKNLLGDRKIYKLEVEKNKDIYVTGNHRFWSFYTKNMLAGWNSIKDMKDLMDDVKNECYISIPTETNIVNAKDYKITDDFAKFIGILIGYKIGLTSDKDNIIKACKEIFGTPYDLDYDDDEIVNELLNCKHTHTYLPNMVFSWSKNLVNSLIAGLIIATTTIDLCIKTEYNATLKLSNEKLMTQLYHLCRNNGISVSINVSFDNTKVTGTHGSIDRSIDRGVMSSDSYCMSIPLNKEIDNKFLKILSITETDRNDEYVYTLGVKDDHSYTVEGLIAENCYVEPWHADIYEFMELRKTSSGNDENRSRDLFLASWIPDLFMKRVEADQVWSLMCPDECPNLDRTHGDEFDALYLQYEKDGKFKKQVKARDLWNHLLQCQIETGFTYMCYKDNSNNKSNQKNLGTIRCSNLCVHGDTLILTDEGQIQISTLENKKVNVWNGNEWSNVTIKKTAVGVDLIRVSLSNGSYIDCTPEHKFYTQTNYWSKEIETQASELKVGDKLIKIPELPTITYKENEPFDYAYTHGFFCGDGTTYNSYDKKKLYPKAYLYGEKKKLLKYLDYESKSEYEPSDRYDLVLPKKLRPKFEVPMYASIENRLRWLEGYVDADGTIVKNGTNESLQITSTNSDFINNVKLMIQTLGVESKVTLNKKARKELMPDGKGGQKEYNCKPIYRCLISSTGLYKLSTIGFNPKRLKFEKREPKRCAEHFTKVVSVTPSYKNVDTFCFTEPKRHKGVFNGILTGQCSEIIEYTDANTIAVCNLASICLPRFVYDNNGKKEFDFDLLEKITRIIVRNLNKVIDINYYPTDSTEKSNKKHRPIGIGIQGEADVFNLFGYSYESESAEILNKLIFETIYFASIDESKELAKKYGHYVSFRGSPFSQGKLQYHLWGMETKDLLTKDKYDWDNLVREVQEFGTRNSLLTALMPTAGTSQIMKCYESFEPYISNIFVKTTMAGEFIVINDNLMRDLIKLNLWDEDMRKLIIINNGSIQNIDSIPQYIKDIYKTAFEIKLKSMINLSAGRGPFIDQSQSMNLFMKNPDPSILTSAHFHGWKSGLKTGMYYLRGSPSVNPIQFGIDIADVMRLTGRTSVLDMINGDFDIKKSELNISSESNKSTESNDFDKSVQMCKYIPGKNAEGCLMCSS